MKIIKIRTTYLKHIVRNSKIEDKKGFDNNINDINILNKEKIARIKDSINKYNEYIFNNRISYYKVYLIK